MLDRELMVNALLNTQSDTTFILERTCPTLGVSGVSVKLSLSTMYAEHCMTESRRVRGLQVRGINSLDKIELRVTFSLDFIPASKFHVSGPEVVKSIRHLKHMEYCPPYRLRNRCLLIW